MCEWQVGQNYYFERNKKSHRITRMAFDLFIDLLT